MSYGNQGIRPTGTDTPTNPTLYTVSAPVAGTEYSQLLASNTKKFTILVKDGAAKLQFAYTAGQSGTNFFPVPVGCAYTVVDINYTGSIYFQTNKASQVVVIEVWV